MARIKDDVVITHIFADGTVMTDEEFMAKPIVVDKDKNPEIWDGCMEILSPEYRAAKVRRKEWVELRRRQLAEQEAAINKALNKN